MWQITREDLESIAIGAGILGTGGGGNPYLGKLTLLSLLEEGYQVEVVDLDTLADDALVTEVGMMGAPTVGGVRGAASGCDSLRRDWGIQFDSAAGRRRIDRKTGAGRRFDGACVSRVADEHALYCGCAAGPCRLGR